MGKIEEEKGEEGKEISGIVSRKSSLSLLNLSQN